MFARLIIEEVPQSLNKTHRMHWAARHRYNMRWQTLVRSAINNGHKPCKSKMLVSISQMRARLLDKDNLYGSVKPIVDALKYWKLIKDDSTQWIELDCRQQTGKPVATVIEIRQELPK